MLGLAPVKKEQPDLECFFDRSRSVYLTTRCWGTKALMDYVGWRDVQSAIRYIDAAESFGDWRR